MADHYHLILCRARQAKLADTVGPPRLAFEEELLRRLPSDERRALTVVSHLYDLQSDGSAADVLRSLSGHLVVL
ncbi:MAG: hypothetical protein JW888_07610, partial [Pirellulales bacterium]|nr:hypothetical protein [Pirellulales bacterium]